MACNMKVSIEGVLFPLAGCIYLFQLFQLNRNLCLDEQCWDRPILIHLLLLMREHLGLRVIRSFRGAKADMCEYYTAKGTTYSV